MNVDMENVYKEYFAIVYKYLLYLTRNSELAEEFTQDTFVKAIMKIHTFRGDSKISTWLCSIARNIYYNYLKKKKKEMFLDDLEVDIIDFFNNTENIVIKKERIQYIKDLMEKLDPKTSEVMKLRVIGNLSYKEIGIVFGKTENWARTVFYRGKNKLKEGDCYEND